MRNQALGVGDFLGTGDPKSLTPFERLHKCTRLEQTVVRAHVEPGKTAAQPLHVDLSTLKIRAVNIGYL